MITISHYTSNESENAIRVHLGRVALYFSYNTIVAYHTDAEGLVVSENAWTRTTGKHLNAIDSNHNHHLPTDEFQRRLANLLRRVDICLRYIDNLDLMAQLEAAAEKENKDE
jgi:hypothetical protein